MLVQLGPKTDQKVSVGLALGEPFQHFPDFGLGGVKR